MFIFVCCHALFHRTPPPLVCSALLGWSLGIEKLVFMQYWFGVTKNYLSILLFRIPLAAAGGFVFEWTDSNGEL